MRTLVENLWTLLGIFSFVFFIVTIIYACIVEVKGKKILEDDKKASIKEAIQSAEKLLEWCPVCSEGSSGYLRQERLRNAIARVKEEQ